MYGIGEENLIVQRQAGASHKPPQLVTQQNMIDAGTTVTDPKEEELGLSTTIDSLVCLKLEAKIKNYVLLDILNVGISSKSSLQRD